MDITPLVGQEKKTITAYGAGGFSLNQQRHEGSLFICGAFTSEWDGQLTAESLIPLLMQCAPDLFLIGTGKTMLALDPALRAALKAQNIALDVMDTGAACRTYNIVMAEDRRVAAALVAI